MRFKFGRLTGGPEVLSWTPIDHKALKRAPPPAPPVLTIQLIAQQGFSMSKTAITSSELAPSVGPFSQAISVGGFIYVSGQVGQDPTTGKLVAGGLAAE